MCVLQWLTASFVFELSLPICWCCLDRGPGSFDVEDATTLSWSSAAVSEWVSCQQTQIKIKIKIICITNMTSVIINSLQLTVKDGRLSALKPVFIEWSAMCKWRGKCDKWHMEARVVFCRQLSLPFHALPRRRDVNFTSWEVTSRSLVLND